MAADTNLIFNLLQMYDWFSALIVYYNTVTLLDMEICI